MGEGVLNLDETELTLEEKETYINLSKREKTPKSISSIHQKKVRSRGELKWRPTT